MFERFTDRARRVLVYAQQEASLLKHGFIGTEHLLLGLMDEGEGVAARALHRQGLTIEAIREKVDEVVSSTSDFPSSPPFTPRAKKVLELSLREALQLGHNYIGTEHMLLGLIRESEGAAARVLVNLGTDLARLRQDVIEILAGIPEPERPPDEESFETLRERAAMGVLRRSSALVACSFCGRRPPDSGRLVKGQDALICEYCVVEWGERLRTSPDDDAPSHPGAALYEPEDGGEDRE